MTAVRFFYCVWINWSYGGTGFSECNEIFYCDDKNCTFSILTDWLFGIMNGGLLCMLMSTCYGLILGLM